MKNLKTTNLNNDNNKKNKELEKIHDYIKNNFFQQYDIEEEVSEYKEKFLKKSENNMDKQVLKFREEVLKIKEYGIQNIISKIDTIYNFCFDKELLNEEYSDNFYQYITELYVPYILYNKFGIYNIQKGGKEGKPDFYFENNEIKYWIEVTTSNQGKNEKNKVPSMDCNEPEKYFPELKNEFMDSDTKEFYSGFIINEAHKRILNRIKDTLERKQQQKEKWIKREVIGDNDKIILVVNINGAFNENFQPYTNIPLYEKLFFENIFEEHINNFLNRNGDFDAILIFSVEFLDSIHNYLENDFFSDYKFYTKDNELKKIF